ncbi:LNS2 (Lipin/Ned1/Smp2) [compost metagenome]
MKLAIIDLCNTLADINSVLRSRGLDPTGHAIPAGIPLWLDHSLYLSAEPINPSIQFVTKLAANGYSLIYLTARPKETTEASAKWLKDQNLPQGKLVHSDGVPKGELILKYTQDHLVTDLVYMEDSPREIQSYLNICDKITATKKLVIVRQEYNAELDADEEILFSV